MREQLPDDKHNRQDPEVQLRSERRHIARQRGAYPKRVVVRGLARKSSYLWHKKQTNDEFQYIYRPQDVHITHICIYSVGSTLCHRMQTMQSICSVSMTLPKEKYGLLYDAKVFTNISVNTTLTVLEDDEAKKNPKLADYLEIALYKQ